MLVHTWLTQLPIFISQIIIRLSERRGHARSPPRSPRLVHPNAGDSSSDLILILHCMVICSYVADPEKVPGGLD